MKTLITKKCTKCGQIKLAKEFYKRDTTKDGLRHDCIVCCGQYRVEHRDSTMEWRRKNKDAIRECYKKYCQTNREKIKEQSRQRYIKNIIKKQEYARNRHRNLRNRKDEEILYPEKRKCNRCGQIKLAQEFYKQRDMIGGLGYRCKKCNKIYRETHKEQKRQWSKKYNKKNREMINAHRRQRRKIDLNYKITCNLRGRLYHALKSQNAKKSNHTLELIGCSVNFLRKYLEDKFTEGMAWGNYGVRGWHIDHIIPCAYFDLTKPEEQEKCFHYTNFQPMWEPDNYRKNSFYNGKYIGRDKYELV